MCLTAIGAPPVGRNMQRKLDEDGVRNILRRTAERCLKGNVHAVNASQVITKSSVTFEEDGAFTLAVLTVGDRKFVGVSKRNPKDAKLPLRGQAFSLSRAARKALAAGL